MDELTPSELEPSLHECTVILTVGNSEDFPLTVCHLGQKYLLNWF